MPASRRARAALYLPTDAEMLAARKDMETPLTFEEHLTVRATGIGPWAGHHVVDAVSRIRGELGEPHVSYLPELADRGYRATLLARSLAALEGLSADGTAAGWRLTAGYAAEGDAARSLLESDINTLADVVGKESGLAPGSIKVRLLGPLSLAASAYLTNGERVLSDYGARRDLAESQRAGFHSLVRLLEQAVPGAQVLVQIDEPLLGEVAAGQLPTSSGYRTLRAVPRHELVALLGAVHSELEGLGVKVVTRADYLRLHPEVGATLATPMLSMAGQPTSAWEALAPRLEAKGGLYLETADPLQRVPAGELAHSLWRTWSDLGLGKTLLNQLVLAETGNLAVTDPQRATSVLGHLTETARALSEIAQEA
ncbi:MAG: hypothetical protein SPI83_05890 [Rothia sp. (in: high G+C Gram-positive bacteria)]|nr:hypothetical protein [Rothia sp. (in: high G+C Gram-positive bacteria)]